MNSKMRSPKGFTLIELLIVIVIIGILAGVTIGVINPAAQQNRAKDANVKAAMNKVALATQAFITSYGSIPTDTQFIGSLDNATDVGTTCAAGNDYVCLYSITGNVLPTTGCNASPNNWNGNGTGTTACAYRYSGTLATNSFVINAKSFGILDVVFQYANTGTYAGIIQHCVGGTAGTLGACTTP